jgi:hypothetical protein
VNFGLELPRYEVYMKTDDPNAKICLNYQTPRDKALKQFCYKTKGTYNPGYPNRAEVAFGLTVNEGLVTPVVGPNGWIAFDSLFEAKSFIMNEYLEKLHVSFPNFQYEIIGRDPKIRCELI